MRGEGAIRVPVLFGPTASGKTALAIEVVERAGGAMEILSADSRQVYRFLDIGTAKPTDDQQNRVPHHLLDLITPDVTYAAGEWSRSARTAVAELLQRNVVPFVVGGAGFYIRALFEGLGAPPADPAVLAQLDARLRSEGPEALYEELRRVDPEGAALHDPMNGARTMRALACWEGHGVPYSRWHQTADPFTINGNPVVPALALLDPERSMLYACINRRVEEMMEAGLVEETEQVLAMGYQPDSPGLRTVGYAETVAYLEGRVGKERAVEDIQQATRRYAKRQVTWMRGQMKEGRVVDVSDPEAVVRWVKSEEARSGQ